MAAGTISGMRVLLVSTYELGHQPLHVASPAALLAASGHEVRALDLAVESFDDEPLDWAEVAAISVPMHTAMRLARMVVGRIRERHGFPIALYGLYADQGDLAVDAVFVGEYERGLAGWLAGERSVGVDLSIQHYLVPERSILPPLDRYAHLQTERGHRLVGYVEASHGCRHRCAHCPIPSVYDGVFRVVGVETVLSDIDRLVEMGAEHVTFGDPDFFNGPAHSLRIIEAAKQKHPSLGFDVTIKVEHLLEHADLIPRLAGAGVVFIVSAFETTDDEILRLLGKGHTAADEERALALVRAAGMEIHPSWMPFTPLTTPRQVVDIFAFLDRHDLFGVTDPVQMTIRLLIPNGSLVLQVPELAVTIEGFDDVALGYRWRSVDPAADELAARLAKIAGEDADRGVGSEVTLARMWREALGVVGEDREVSVGASTRPRLTEPWFC